MNNVPGSDAIENYHDQLSPSVVAPCRALRLAFDAAFGVAAGKLYHGSPVWFLDENPIVGYSVKKAGVAVLFWSGQSFQEPGLTPAGKHKAAELLIGADGLVPQAKLEAWLAESKTVIWDYKNIARRQGVLERL